MLDTIIHHTLALISAIPFSGATWFVIFTLGFFMWLFKKANQDPINPIQWEHLIIDSASNRTSPYKLGYLVGLIVATWVVVTITDKDKLTLDIFGAYLAYLVGGVGVSAYAKKELNQPTSGDTTPPSH